LKLYVAAGSVAIAFQEGEAELGHEIDELPVLAVVEAVVRIRLARLTLEQQVGALAAMTPDTARNSPTRGSP
jgi:hypothetical protein